MTRTLPFLLLVQVLFEVLNMEVISVASLQVCCDVQPAAPAWAANSPGVYLWQCSVIMGSFAAANETASPAIAFVCAVPC